MKQYQTDDVRIRDIKELLPPVALIEAYKQTEISAATTFQTRKAIHQILQGQDDRLVVIVGPCSIHDPKSALEYAEKLLVLRETLKDSLEIVMRVYFEKPRTTVGWKGLINDPYMDQSFQINDGLRIARKLLLDITNLGIPTAVECLDMIMPQYIGDFLSWGAIGARTTESQIHRELSSGMSCPVGFKNGTDGNVTIAIDAICSSSSPHHFLSVTKYGHSAIVSTNGNNDCHLILRGGNEPNYSATHIKQAQKNLIAKGLKPNVMVDFSHANSLKAFKRQLDVATDVATQIASGNKGIFGVMIESHLVEGRQDILPNVPPVYGQSITDACLGWTDTETVLQQLATAVQQRRQIS